MLFNNHLLLFQNVQKHIFQHIYKNRNFKSKWLKNQRYLSNLQGIKHFKYARSFSSFSKSDSSDYGLFGLRMKKPSDLLKLANNAVLYSEKAVKKLLSQKNYQNNYTNEVLPKNALYVIDDISNILCSVADPSELLRHVHNDEEWRNVANTCIEKISEFIGKININKPVYELLISCYEMDIDKLNKEERLVLKHMIESMKHQGVHLSNHYRDEYLNLLQEELVLSFSIIETSYLKHQPAVLPSDLTLPPDPQLYQQLLKHSEQSELRKRIWYSQRKSDPESLKKMLNLCQIRTKLSEIRGFKDYLEYSQKECILNGTDVEKFLVNCTRLIKERLLDDLKELKNIKKKYIGEGVENGADEVMPWDVDYLVNKKRSEGRIYLSISTVLEFFKKLLNKLFNINLVLDTSKEMKWDKDVIKFNLVDKGMTVAHLYLDLFERPNKTTICAQFTIRCSKAFPYGLSNNIDNNNDKENNNKTKNKNKNNKKEEKENNERSHVMEIMSRDNYYQFGNKLKQIPSTVVVSSFNRPDTNKDNGNNTNESNTTNNNTNKDNKDNNENNKESNNNNNDNNKDNENKDLLLENKLLQDVKVDLYNCEILFHELGHTLHTLLSDTELQHLSGNRGSIDYAEFSSHLFELFFQKNVKDMLKLEKLENIFSEDEMKMYKKYESVELGRMIVLSRIDQRFYSNDHRDDWEEIEKNLDYSEIFKEFEYFNEKIGEFSLVQFLGTPALTNFDHLVHYGGNYYCYLYSRMLALKVYNSFDGLSYEEIGKRLLEFFRNGSVDSSINPINKLAGKDLNKVPDLLFFD